MSKARVRWRQVTFLAIVSSGSLAACGQASKDVPTPGSGTGGSAAGGAPSNSTSGGAVSDGGGRASGGANSGKGGGVGATSNAGGAAGSSGSAVDGGTSGAEGGDGGGDAGASGASGAGGKGTIVEPYFRAGSRLKPRVFRVGDLEVLDTVLEQSWYDAETAQWCTFQVGADGIERCFPNTQFSEDVLTYSDAACTRPAVRGLGQSCGVASSYLTIEPVSGCGYRAYKVGAARPYNTPVYEQREGACRRAPTVTDPSISVSPLEEVPAETFVAVNRVSRPRHPGMNALVREGEDGSWEIVGFSEPAQDAPCFGLGLDVTSQFCVPDWGQIWDYFGDAACTQRVGFQRHPRCAGRTDTVLLEMTTDAKSCEQAQSIVGLWQSAGTRSTRVFDTSSGVCMTRSTEPQNVYVQGAPIDLGSLPKLEVIEVGEGPLRLAFYGFGGMPFLPASRRFESALPFGRFTEAASGESCWPELFQDGTWRCVPSSFEAVQDFELYYESEDCTGQPVFPAPAPRDCMGKQRESRGLIVRSFGVTSCFGLPVIDTLQFGEKFSPLLLSGLKNGLTCRTTDVASYPSMLRLNKVNPAELFVPMERELKD